MKAAGATSSKRRAAPRSQTASLIPAKPSKIAHRAFSGLGTLAEALGIQTSYVDMAGKREQASPETLAAILELWGVEAREPAEARAALRELEIQRWRQVLEPVLVAWDGRSIRAEIRLPAALDASPASCRILLENGQTQQVRLPRRHGVQARVTLAGETFTRKRVSLPQVPPGYHQLQFECRGRVHRALLISAPIRAYTRAGEARLWCVFLPMYAVHSVFSWGAGNLGDWRRLSRWAGSLGATGMSTLPLLANFLGPGLYDPSPYSPVSRLFWNEFYIDILSLPEFKACRRAQRIVGSRAFAARLENFRRNTLVDYPAEMAARRQVLETIALHFFRHDNQRREDFERFLQQRADAKDYSGFRATTDKLKKPWPSWKPRQRDGDLSMHDYSESDFRYHLFAQWVMQRQMSALVEEGRRRGIELYLDLPLGVHPHGYDIWRNRDLFAFPATTGAPPDMFFTKGQDWGFAPLHPDRLRQEGYRYVIDYLRFQMRHAGFLRIDHVMGLHRLYWIPRGFSPENGAFVRYRADELLAIFCLESHRNKTVLVGENLGTVPPEVNEDMQRHRLRQMCVLQYEQRASAKKPLPPPPQQAVASLNTHDMPTFAAHWEAQDVELRQQLGLLSSAKASQERARREKLKAALVRFLSKQRLLHPGARTAQVLKACLEWLALSPAEMVQINLDDLWLETQPQNVPGTGADQPNWCRKTRLRLEEIEQSADIRKLLKRIDRLRRIKADGHTVEEK